MGFIYDNKDYDDNSYLQSPAWKEYVAFLNNSGANGGITGTLAGGTNSVKTPAAAGSSGGGGGRVGYGGGGGSGRVPLNLKVYKRGQWNTNGLQNRAQTRTDARYRDAMLGTQRQRMDAENQYGKSIREIEMNQGRDTRDNAMQREAALAANSNVALNRGMGYGGGFLQTQTNARSNYDRMLNDLMETYANQRYGLMDDRNNIYAQTAAQDAVALANRSAWLEEFLQSLEDSSWNRYMGTEGLRQSEIDSQNNAIRGKAGL